MSTCQVHFQYNFQKKSRNQKLLKGRTKQEHKSKMFGSFSESETLLTDMLFQGLIKKGGESEMLVFNNHCEQIFRAYLRHSK